MLEYRSYHTQEHTYSFSLILQDTSTELKCKRFFFKTNHKTANEILNSLFLTLWLLHESLAVKFFCP